MARDAWLALEFIADDGDGEMRLTAGARARVACVFGGIIDDLEDLRFDRGFEQLGNGGGNIVHNFLLKHCSRAGKC